MNSISEINTNTHEGRLLMAALARLTTEIDTSKTPDQVLTLLDVLAEGMYVGKPKVNLVHEAVRQLSIALVQDEDYYRTWLDNMSIQFSEEVINKMEGLSVKVVNQNIRKSCNKAANNFLQSLIREELKKYPVKTFLRHENGKLEELGEGHVLLRLPPDECGETPVRDFCRPRSANICNDPSLMGEKKS